MLRCSIGLACVLWATCSFAQSTARRSSAAVQDAAALESQYKLCANHYIPADKCTPEIYQQLNAPLDLATAAALKAAKDWAIDTPNPDSLRVGKAYVMSDGQICMIIAVETPDGTMGKWEQVVYSNLGESLGYRWTGCPVGAMKKEQHSTTFKDVTEQVKQALKDGR